MRNPLKLIVAAVVVSFFMIAPNAQAKDLSEINISYVKAPFNLQVMVMRKHELLEKAFADEGIRIVWHDITSGAHQTQAMAAGSLDVGSVMNTTSILMANAGGNPVRIAAGVSRPAKTFAIMGRPGGPATIAELKGTKIAGPRGTVLHQLLAAALASKGMGLSDVEYMGMDLPKAQTALIAGHVDAAMLAAGLMIKAEEAGARVIATADGLLNPILVMAVRDGFAEEHSEALNKVVRVHRETTGWIAANLDEAIALGAEAQGISVENATKLAQWAGFTAVLTPRDLDSIREDMAFLMENDMLQKAVDVDALVLDGAMAGKKEGAE